MSAAAIMDIIGVISGITGIIQFGMDNFPQQDTKASTLNIAVGLDYDGGLTNAGGHVPNVMLWNEAGEYLGSGGSGKVSDGSTATVTVDQGDNGQQAPYALLVAGNDAVCIAYVSITWPDNNQYAFTGDWGEACGGSWYYSNIFVSSSNYKPKCMWIDANGDQPQTGFQVHFPEFKSDDGTVPSGKDTNYFCNSKAPFSLLTTANPNTISYFKPGTTEVATSSPVSKRDTVKARKTPLGRRATADTRLVVTSSTDHSATELCKSKTSAGPDLANTAEKVFCRMSDKTTFPICDTTTTDNCFNADSKQLIVGGKAARASYDLFIDWTTEGKTTTTAGNAARDLSNAAVETRDEKYTEVIDW